jgi:adenosylcobinamide kinase / adenosylcobinamide-phosphate guanylyltransferase
LTLQLVIGGTRSGKSRRGERLAAATGRTVRSIATADAGDTAFAERIRAHEARRPAGWQVVESGTNLRGVLVADVAECVLLDGLGVWIATVFHHAGVFDAPGDDALLERVRAEVLHDIDAIIELAARVEVIVVAEEAGQGVLPPDRASRSWLDLQGDAVLRLADAAARVELVVAGRVTELQPG